VSVRRANPSRCVQVLDRFAKWSVLRENVEMLPRGDASATPWSRSLEAKLHDFPFRSLARTGAERIVVIVDPSLNDMDVVSSASGSIDR